MIATKQRITCDSCQLARINGVVCHETGCRNSRSRWDAESGEWIKQRECFECGCTVDADDPCCDAERDEEPDHNDEVLCCPDCERPNQFGELCASCDREHALLSNSDADYRDRD